MAKAKKLAINFLLCLLLASAFNGFVLAADSTSTSFILRDPVFSIEGGRSTSTSFEYYSSTGLPVGGESTSTSFRERVGFLFLETALFNQNSFRFYNNEQTLALANPIATENADIIIEGSRNMRLRINVTVTAATLLASGRSFKLQYAALGNNTGCATIPGANFSDIGVSGTFIGTKTTDSSLKTIGDNATLSATLLSNSNVAETYEEDGAATTVRSVSINQSGEWDFALLHLEPHTAETYCFRLVTSDNATFNTYTRYPQITISPPPVVAASASNAGPPLKEKTDAAAAKEAAKAAAQAAKTAVPGEAVPGEAVPGEEITAEEAKVKTADEAAKKAIEAPKSTSSIYFLGYTFPGGTVVILKDGQIIKKTEALSNGFFEIEIDQLSDGIYNFSFYTQDQSSAAKTKLYTLPVKIKSGLVNEIKNIYLPPTITTNKIKVEQGEEILISGKGAPNSDITTVFEAEGVNFVLKTQTNQNGKYFYSLKTDELPQGTYSLYSYLTHSQNSEVVTMEVTDKTVLRTIPAVTVGDLNQDGYVNLIDFSITAFWYLKPLSSPAAATVDLNSDGKVDLVDFSILIYYWSG